MTMLICNWIYKLKSPAAHALGMNSYGCLSGAHDVGQKFSQYSFLSAVSPFGPKDIEQMPD